ncbi:winged helix-turn-helix transcriptional regulator [Lipingzhangella sp. LS1_29]|uniref:Winged helix-turn-helix transcriptional regulator n=1 Tax=Lipingzhangella rawalii TaxID=2055835 RepID=A0ABU2H0D1_9ACTN|nr:MarR family transcriptional regulator [Lipingzhangella rawalii]MDS1268763.1 winged helix-turn-helix transcriptional regulator [Lipingzhangella rawalii]
MSRRERSQRSGAEPPRRSGAAELNADTGTRAAVARLILEQGPITASALGERLGLTSAAIRRHLDNLTQEGMVTARDAHPGGQRRRGRPPRVYTITDAGRDTFVHGYDDLAASALRFLAEKAGPDAVAEFAHRQVADLERRYHTALAGVPPQQRVRLLAEALSADGYAASVEQAPAPGGGEQLCQHHCPVAHVAAEFPELCEAEMAAFARLLETPVRRLATIAHGDAVCTTHVSPRDLGPAERQESTEPSQ